MLIHSYLTNGKPVFDFAKLFLESFKYHNGEDIKIVFSTRNLSEKQQKILHIKYGNLDIINENFNYEKLRYYTGKPIKYLKKVKSDVENGINISGKPDHVIMKQFISVEDRYRNSIKDVMDKYNDYGHMIHCDIDLCFARNLSYLFDIVRNNDISIKFRNVDNTNKRFIVGYLIGFAINNKTYNFMNTWINYIDKLSLAEKPKGYGQLSLRYAWEDWNNYLKVGEIDNWITASSNNYLQKDNFPIILSGNKRTKNWNIKYFKKIYKRDKEMKKERRWETLHSLLKNTDHKIGAEIGAFKGATSKYLLDNLKNLETLICVDPWIKYPDFEKVIYNKKLQKTDFEKEIYQAFMSNIEEHKNRVTIYRTFSSEAAKEIEDNSLDFIFIDGNHSYEYVKEDIELWYPKVKKGGLVSGHDYGQDPNKYPGFGVDKAVNEYFGKDNIEVENKIWYTIKE